MKHETIIQTSCVSSLALYQGLNEYFVRINRDIEHKKIIASYFDPITDSMDRFLGNGTMTLEWDLYDAKKLGIIPDYPIELDQWIVFPYSFNVNNIFYPESEIVDNNLNDYRIKKPYVKPDKQAIEDLLKDKLSNILETYMLPKAEYNADLKFWFIGKYGYKPTIY